MRIDRSIQGNWLKVLHIHWLISRTAKLGWIIFLQQKNPSVWQSNVELLRNGLMLYSFHCKSLLNANSRWQLIWVSESCWPFVNFLEFIFYLCFTSVYFRGVRLEGVRVLKDHLNILWYPSSVGYKPQYITLMVTSKLADRCGRRTT